MSIVILKGNQQQMWDINGHFLCGGRPHFLDDKQLESHRDCIERVLDEEVKKSEEIIETQSEVIYTEKKVIYTEKGLFDMTKIQQVELLKELGITKIPSLEKDRVKAILEAQK